LKTQKKGGVMELLVLFRNEKKKLVDVGNLIGHSKRIPEKLEKR
jgi:hypothetical protein